MYDRNGWPQRPVQIQKRGVLKGLAKALQTLREPWLHPVRVGLLLTLLVLAVSLLGCATTSAPSDFTPANPSMPQPSQSQPSVPYLTTAQESILRWRKQLQDTLVTP